MPTMSWAIFSVEDILVNPTKSLPSVNCCSRGGGGGAQESAGKKSANHGYNASLEPPDSWANYTISRSPSFFINKLKKLTR